MSEVAMIANAQEALKLASQTLGIPQDDLLVQGLRRYLQSQLHEVQAAIFQIVGQYNAPDVAALEDRYREGSLDEASSWHDLQKLDHLEYKRDRLQHLLESLP
ncbi:MAG: hypothetical protein WBO55_18565 [Rhizobiaceae bacterium]